MGLYCSAICQKLDYKPKHKAICKRLVVFGNNSSMQRPPEGRERDIYDGWAAQQETGFRTCTQFLRNTFLLRNTLSD